VTYAGPVYNDGNDWKYLGATTPISEGLTYASAVFISGAGAVMTLNSTNANAARYRGPQFVIGTDTYVHEQTDWSLDPAGVDGAARLLDPVRQDSGSITTAELEAPRRGSDAGEQHLERRPRGARRRGTTTARW